MWTATPPTEQGYYHWLGKGYTKSRILFVYKSSELQLTVEMTGFNRMINEIGGQWWDEKIKLPDLPIKYLASADDIIIGQFYKSQATHKPYYYIGTRFGKTKQIVCLNLPESEAIGDNLLSNANIADWKLLPCSQYEAMGVAP